jgi:O-antigen ligase
MIRPQTLADTASHYLFKLQYLVVQTGAHLLGPLVIVFSLLLSLGLGFLIVGGIFDEIMLLAALIAPIGILILYKLGKYEYGIVLIIISAGIIRFHIPVTQWSVIVTSLIVSLGIVGVWIMQMVIHDKKIQLKASPINKPVLSFIAVNIISYIWGIVFRDPLVVTWNSFPIVQLAALTVNILLPILTLLVSNKLLEVKWLKWITGFIIAFGTGAVILRLLKIYIPDSWLIAIHDGGLFSAWVCVLAYGMALFNEKLSWLIRVFLLALVGAWVYYSFVLATSWISGWLPTAIACAVITFLRSKRLFICATIIGSIYFLVNFNFYWENIVMAEEEEGSGTGRIGLWERNLNHIVKHPFFGMGPAGYAVYNMSYHPDDARSTHNNYFDIAAQMGLIGLGVFLWMFIGFIRTGNKIRRRLLGDRDFEEAFVNASIGGIIGALVAMMLGDWVLPFAYNQGIAGFDNALYTWVFIGCMVSLYHGVNARKHEADRGTGLCHNPTPISTSSISSNMRDSYAA